MEDTHTLIKNVAVDVIATTAIWGIINHSYQSHQSYAVTKDEVNSNFFYYSVFVGIGISVCFIAKYK